VKLLYSVILCTTGLACGWFFLIRPIIRRPAGGTAVLDDRPWRRVGAAVCLLLGVVFPLGIYHQDSFRSPHAFVAFWAIIIVVVSWLFVLAIRDLAHRRHLLQSRRSGRKRGRKGENVLRPQTQGRDP